MGRPSLCSAFLCLLAGCVAPSTPPPPNIVAEGVPPVPAALAAELSPYLNLGGAGFRGWHATRRAALVTTRVGDASHLHLMDAPLARRVPLTGGVEPVKSGRMQPDGTLLPALPDGRRRPAGAARPAHRRDCAQHRGLLVARRPTDRLRDQPPQREG
jgi:hypothetical protein